MAAASRKTNKKRARRLARMGRKRKAANRTQGTTKTAAELFGDK
jgi:hypothetical protein